MMLDFLPLQDDWSNRFAEVRKLTGVAAIRALRELAGAQLSFTQAGKLDRAITQALRDEDARASLPIFRLGLIGSATTSHLPAGIRIAALRRGIIADVYEGAYGMYMQELTDSSSGLQAFRPDALLIALDAHHLAGAAGSTADGALRLTEQCWALAHRNLRCAILQQTVLPVFPPYLGNNEQRSPSSPANIVDEVNSALRRRADESGVHLLAVDSFFRREGLAGWYEPALWYKSKHEIHPRAAMVYGDQVARELAALRGTSLKCLVLDLDNTLWGGVIGDDGLDGIVLGQGNAVGEAYVDFQRYCVALASRGVILAVCSKNDEANARLPFAQHPEMVLRESDIACFVANWQDKASNLRQIAATLNIGIDSLVFADDNPAERALIRRELPSVQVPELPADPALYADIVARAGYFEGLRVTAEDQERSRQYQANAKRARLAEDVTDIESYLESLAMQLTIEPFTEVGIARTTQLINKTNQFNLTTRRYSEQEVRDLLDSPDVITLQARLKDRFGDNGTIAIMIARRLAAGEAHIDTWLMSCRVLGRKVEEACLDALVGACRANEIDTLVGIYKPTEKNGMVCDLYSRLGFLERAVEGISNQQHFTLQLASYQAKQVPIRVHNRMTSTKV